MISDIPTWGSFLMVFVTTIIVVGVAWGKIDSKIGDIYSKLTDSEKQRDFTRKQQEKIQDSMDKVGHVVNGIDKNLALVLQDIEHVKHRVSMVEKKVA